MLTATQERTQTHTVEVGFDDEGRVLALRHEFVHDTGAYTPRELVGPLLTAGTMSGPYRIPNIEVSFASVYTNRVPVTPYRGAGQPQAVFVLERVMDLIARETGRDRAAVRFANFVQPADMPYDTGLPNYRGFGNVVYDSGDYPAVLRRALEMSNCLRARQEGRLLGVGVACYVELTGVGPFGGATVRADAAGRLTVLTGVPSQGQGLETTLAQIAAGELGVTPDEVTVIGGDTLGIGRGIGTFASRAAVVGGTAVALAARELRAKCVRLAAQALGIAEDEVQQHSKVFAFRATPRVLSRWGGWHPRPPSPRPRAACRPGSRRRTTSSRPTSRTRAAPTWRLRR
jgi:aerobic carbon-monoxide dehydrogenase large subunit